MTDIQFILTLYALCAVSTLGIYAVNAGSPRSWGGWYTYTVLAVTIVTAWPIFFALALYVAADLNPAGKRWRAP